MNMYPPMPEDIELTGICDNDDGWMVTFVQNGALTDYHSRHHDNQPDKDARLDSMRLMVHTLCTVDKEESQMEQYRHARRWAPYRVARRYIARKRYAACIPWPDTLRHIRLGAQRVLKRA